MDKSTTSDAAVSELMTIQKAAQRVGLSWETLRTLVQSGRIRAGNFNGDVLMSIHQARKARRLVDKQKAHLPVDRSQFKDLEDKPIRLSVAATKYEITHGNLSYWAQRGHVRVLARGPKVVLLNEADVAFAAALVQSNGGMRQGKRVFPRLAL